MTTPSPLYEAHSRGVVERDQVEQDWLRAEQEISTAAGRPFGGRPAPKHRRERQNGFRWLA